MKHLLVRTFVGFFVVVGLIGVILFWGAGTFDYWQAWVFIAVYTVSSSLMVGYLWRHNRPLLERRLRGGPTAEADPIQKVIMFFACLCFFGLLLVPALDRRWGWSHVSVFIVVLGDLLVALGHYAVHIVFLENSFAASTVKVADDQRVISTGPYAYVRHPMYAGMLFLLVGMPLSLGSYWALLVFAAMVLVLIWRLLKEEEFLAKNLPGYTDYQAKVSWHLIPKIY